MVPRLFFILIATLVSYPFNLFAISTRVATVKEQDLSTTSQISDTLLYYFGILINIILFIIIFWILLKILRLTYEVMMAGRLMYMKVTLPRADSKLDKERETKKDFKEKVGIMSVFYKSVHNLTQSSAFDTVMNFIFHHAKVSLELMYHDGMVHFYVVGYKEHVTLVLQQITSNYPDAEVKVIQKKDFPEIKPIGFTLQAASVGKHNDDVFPIKTYKYFEDDPLSTFTNNFGSLKKTDVASIQFVIKPLGYSWNKKAKNAAALLAKGQYKK